jgi:hypothetical protein
MSGNRQFVDTNVLVYAYDVTAGINTAALAPWSRSSGIPGRAA